MNIIYSLKDYPYSSYGLGNAFPAAIISSSSIRGEAPNLNVQAR